MPDLLPPRVVGELSTLNTFVIIENQQEGTTLRIVAGGNTTIGTKVGASAGRDQVAIDTAFLPLTAGMAITAIQEEAGGAPSKPSPDAVIVQAVPNPLGHAQFLGTIYDCVGMVRVDGLTPGAQFEVHQPDAGSIGPTSLIGKGETYNGQAESVLDRQVSSANELILRELASAQVSDSTYPMPITAVPLIPDRKLLPLTVEEALDCGWYVDVTGTVTGVETRITRLRGGTSTDYTGYGWDDLTRFWVPEPFQSGDRTHADQHMPPRCDIQPSDPSAEYEVQPRVVHPPLIVPPVCLDADELELINIEPGADYAVYAIFKTAAGDKQVLNGRGRFPVKDPSPSININRVEADPDQLPGTVPSLAITQTACGWTSQMSPLVAMEPLGTPLQPRLADPLVACAVYVRVVDVRPGSWVSVHSTRRGGKLSANPAEWMGGRLGRAKATGSEVSIYTSGLIEGDTIWACTTGCQSLPTHSDPKTVDSGQNVALGAHIVTPVYPSDTTITVDKLTTGTRVTTRVIGAKHAGGQKILTSYAWAPTIPVFTGQLFERDQITVFQSLCHGDATENQSNTVSVVLGDMDARIAPTSVTLGTTRNLLVTATDPQRNNLLVPGDVLIGGTKIGQTNTTFAWTAPSTGASAPVQVNAAGYQPWLGSIALTAPQIQQPTYPPHVIGGQKGAKQPSYTYTCKPLTGGVEFTVNGLDFPTAPNTGVWVTAQFDGIFTAFGQPNPCGQDVVGGAGHEIGPFTPDAQGKFTAVVPVLYGCQPTCSVSLYVSKCTGLLLSQITHPIPRYCQCS